MSDKYRDRLDCLKIYSWHFGFSMNIFLFFFLYVITKRGTSLLFLLLPRNNIIVDVISSSVVIIHETLVYQFIGARFAYVWIVALSSKIIVSSLISKKQSLLFFLNFSIIIEIQMVSPRITMTLWTLIAAL